MAVNQIINGVSFAYPQTGDQAGWGDSATAWATAVTNGMLQKAGGSFILTNDANFGPNFGLISKYFKSISANIAQSGVVRLAVGDSIAFRNNANSLDLSLGINGSDQLTYVGSAIQSAISVSDSATVHLALTSNNLVANVIAASLTDAQVSSTAAIALSKLAALAASVVLVSSAGGVISASTITATTLSYLDATSSIQTQLNSKQATGSYLIAVTGDVSASGPGSVAATVNSVGGSTAANVHMAELLVNASRAANLFLASPNGSAAAPSFRSIVAADIPTLNQSTTGNAATVTTNANLTGDVTSSGNASSYNNALPVAKGGTGATVSTSSPTASSNMLRDANGNTQLNNLVESFTSTATAAGTTTLTVASTYTQQFTGTSTQTVVLPVTSTLMVGQQFMIANRSTGIVTVESSGLNVVQTMSANTQVIVTCVLASGTTAASWDSAYSATSSLTNPMTAVGDIIIGGTAGAPSRLAIGSNTNVLTSNGSTLSWQAAGTASPLTTKGDLYGFSTVNARIPVGIDNKIAIADSSATLGISYQYPSAKNYISNPSFESATTTGWALGVTGALVNGLPSAAPTFGSGASVNLSIATVSTGQLSGSNSLKLASTAGTIAGNMVASNAFTIDLQDQAKVLTFKFYYSPTVGASTANWSGTSSNSFAVAIYDVTNSVWLASTANFGITQSSGVGICTGTFQTPSNGYQFRLVVYNANATSGAITILFDDISVSPQTISIGAAITDWQAYAPTFQGLGTPTNVKFSSRRVGDSLEVQGSFTCGTSTATQVQITLGYGGANANVAVDATKWIASINSVGYWNSDASLTVVWSVLATGGNNYLTVGRTNDGSSSAYTSLIGSSWQSGGGNNSFHAIVPIQGWSSNVQMSSDTDTRIIAMKAVATGTVSLTAGSAMILPSIAFDTSGSYNAATGAYTCPVSGYYSISLSGMLAAAAMNFSVYLNGTKLSRFYGPGGASVPISSGYYESKNVAGDVITIVPDTTTTLTYAAGDIIPSLGIARRSGPSVIAVSESVNASYDIATAVATAANGIIKYSTKLKDSHNAYSPTTGIFTVPVSGTYHVSVVVATSAGGTMYAQVNAVAAGYITYNNPGATNSGSKILQPLNAGDTVAILTDTANTTSVSSTGGALNNFSIFRVGN